MKITYNKPKKLYVASELGKIIATDKSLDNLQDRLGFEDDDRPIESTPLTPEQSLEIDRFIDSLGLI